MPPDPTGPERSPREAPSRAPANRGQYDLGVDIGTTFTCAAVTRDGRVDVCQLGTSSALMPTIVSIRDDGRVVVGEAAERRVVTDPARTAREFKRRIGDDAPYVIGGTPYTADQLLGFVLADVVTTVSSREGAAPRRVALTHPADYGRHKLERVRAAAEAAGVTDPLLVPEPVAAALAYSARADIPLGAHILVYDFGGGTFDAALVRRDADGPTLVEVEGVERLGGVDIDEAVFEHTDRTLGGRIRGIVDARTPEARATVARLRDEARRAKEALSDDTESDLAVLLPDAPPTVRLTRAEFETLAERSVAATIPVIDRVVESAGLGWADVHSVLLVGGTSRIPLVAERLRSHTRRPVVSDTDPKATVAVGAAMLAARAAGAVAARTELVEAVAPGAAAGAALDAAETERVVPVAPEPERPDPDRRRRRGLLVVLVALAVLLLAGIGGGLALRDGGGGTALQTTTTADAATSTTQRSTTTLPATSTTGVPATIATSPPTDPPTTTEPPTTTTVPVPTVTSISAATTLTCAEAMAAGGFTDVSWTTTNAASVSIAIDGAGAFAEGLAPNGTEPIPATCDDVQVVTVTPFDALGTPGTGSTITITIGPP
jgi:actin-like ATPase involved in cell morphogenesis